MGHPQTKGSDFSIGRIGSGIRGPATPGFCVAWILLTPGGAASADSGYGQSGSQYAVPSPIGVGRA